VEAELRIWKYQGTGNDFVLLEDLEDRRPLSADLVRALCHRRFGVGADGVIRVTRGAQGRLFMDHRNADGSVAEMCGNGIRCLAAFAHERGLVQGTELEVETRAGVKHLTLGMAGDDVGTVTVGMGPARLSRSQIPMTGPPRDTFLTQPVEVDGLTWKGSALSMGNPHLVLFVEQDPEGVDVPRIGPRLERREWFPQGANVEFVVVQDGGLKVRVWERGVGETMACGTGACAALVAANEAGLVPARAEVRFPGGTLVVERGPEDVWLTGPAERVFEAVLDRGWRGGRGVA
jgi:diaminopimelate epimerase